MSFTIGSLFDGSGGFPLAASLCGGIPKWASEVEPYPVAVTRSRFPDMKHLGDVTKIKGGEVEPVDVISFGSPCQDMSVAGKRAGLKHTDNGDDETTRSGLFMEAVRIIKEMREATNGEYPKFTIWENVQGAFSSNSGNDLRIVLEELIKIVEPSAVMPAVPKNGWPYADSYCGDGWSIAYRLFDAQYWGVPQRRRRIYLVLDLRGQCAQKVLFERKGLRGHSEESRTPWQTVAGDAEGGSGTADCKSKCYGVVSKGNGEAWPIEEKHMALSCGGGQAGQGYPCIIEANGFDGYNSTDTGDKAATLGVNCGMSTGRNGVVEKVPYTVKIRSGCEGGGKGALVQTDKSATLSTLNDQYLFQPLCMATQQGGAEIMKDKSVAYSFDSLASNSMKSNNPHSGCRQVDVAKCLDTTDPNPCKNQGGLAIVEKTDVSGKSFTIMSRDYKAPHVVVYAVDQGGGKSGANVSEGISPTLTCTHGGEPAVAYEKNDEPIVLDRAYQDVVGALCSTDYKWVQQQQVEQDKLIVEKQEIRYIVRRLTPTECARLQGFPDKWGHPNWISEDTKGEVAEFWRNVYLTDCAIKEKKPKPRIAEKQDGWEVAVIRWHNGLHTDSSEYKMWGNGIAHPNALYVMQGIADVMNGGDVYARI